METTCHVSYPLNSENASPPGTFTLYLSFSSEAGASSVTTPRRNATTTVMWTPLRLMSNLLESKSDWVNDLLRQSLARLLAHHIRGVPVRPIVVTPADALFVLTVGSGRAPEC